MSNSQCAIRAFRFWVSFTFRIAQFAMIVQVFFVNAKEFSERLWDFAVDVARLVEVIPNTRVGRHIAGQLIRCGTSSAPNYDEACDAESRNDFAHKLSIAAKELRETSGWLRFLLKLSILPKARLDPVIIESLELRRMLGRSLKSVQSRSDLRK
jgi:four helix bundle protein